MKLPPRPLPPADAAANLLHEGTIACADLDHVAHAGGGLHLCTQPLGDGPAERGGKGGAGGEVSTTAADIANAAGVVATQGIVECPRDEVAGSFDHLPSVSAMTSSAMISRPCWTISGLCEKVMRRH